MRSCNGVKTCPVFHSLHVKLWPLATIINNKWVKPSWLINSQWWSESAETTPQVEGPQCFAHQPCISLCISYTFASLCASGSPPHPDLLVWIISCPGLAARLCAPWIYDGDGWPGLTGVVEVWGGDGVCLCVGTCQWGQGRHGCPTN